MHLDIDFRRKVNVQRHVLKELQNYDRRRVSNLYIKRNSIMKNKSDKEAKLREKDEQVIAIFTFSRIEIFSRTKKNAGIFHAREERS